MRIVRKFVFRALFASTIWFCLGLAVGWYQGSAGGFRRGVVLTSQMVLEILRAKEDETIPSSSPKTEWRM